MLWRLWFFLVKLLSFKALEKLNSLRSIWIYSIPYETVQSPSYPVNNTFTRSFLQFSIKNNSKYLLPWVLGEEKSLTQDAFNDNLLSFPQYTRPVEFEGLSVPEVLLSGNHKAISEWRKEQQIIKTRQRRKDLLEENKSYKYITTTAESNYN